MLASCAEDITALLSLVDKKKPDGYTCLRI